MSSQLVPSVCVDAVFEGMGFSDACRQVRKSGISQVEFWSWWDKDLTEIETALRENELKVSAFCTKFVSLVDPSLRQEYLDGLKESIAVAQRLGVDVLISQVGDFREGIPRSEQYASLVDGLKEAAPILEEAGVILVIEPLNELVDHAGYFLIRSEEAFSIIREVGSDFVKVVFDIYHQQISEGHLLENITGNLELIGHFHAAGNPGRNELQRGEINYLEVFRGIREAGYDGVVGLEYWPKEPDPLLPLREVASWLS